MSGSHRISHQDPTAGSHTGILAESQSRAGSRAGSHSWIPHQDPHMDPKAGFHKETLTLGSPQVPHQDLTQVLTEISSPAPPPAQELHPAVLTVQPRQNALEGSNGTVDRESR